MSYYNILFYVFAFVIVASAIIVVFSKNIVYSAVALFATLFGVAGVFVLLYADFLALTQILVYIGGILVLIIFGIMLTGHITDVNMPTKNLNQLPAVLFSIVLMGILIYTITSTVWKTGTVVKNEITINQIGKFLMTDYLLPFEVASIVLLVALVGAAMYSRKIK